MDDVRGVQGTNENAKTVTSPVNLLVVLDRSGSMHPIATGMWDRVSKSTLRDREKGRRLRKHDAGRFFEDDG